MKINISLCSPMFIQEGPHGTSILYIPSVFISYNGEALDEKSVLLRSAEVLERLALEVLNIIEPKDAGMNLKFLFYLDWVTKNAFFFF